MLKVLDSYRKGVEYYNSQGIKSRPFTAGSRNNDGSGKTSGTFWDFRV